MEPPAERMNHEGVLACCAVCSLQTHRRCGRCLNIYYCNTEHQRQDWRRHKSECAPKESKQATKIDKSGDSSFGTGVEKTGAGDIPNNVISEKLEGSASETRRLKKSRKKNTKDHIDLVNDKQNQDRTENIVQTDIRGNKAGLQDGSVVSSVVYTSKDLTRESAITYEGSSEKEILSEPTQQLSTVEFTMAGSSNVLRAVNRTDIPVGPTFNNEARKEYPEAVLRGSGVFNNVSNNYYMDPSDPCYAVCKRLIKDMTQYGVCVLDNFLGKERGQMVLNEVLEMYRSGIFTAGQLVSNRSSSEAQTVRSDRIAWIDGHEPHCHYINQLINQVDNIVLKANKMANNGKLGDYIINGRTKAMVACYPGSGAHYVKHVDNPNKDGRCITAIYYLNTDWDVSKYGGLLRVFPEGTDLVADIEPLFDRMLFFWSDRRNPHEVQPAYATRYAITLWYFDAPERKEALRQYKEEKERRGQSSSSK